MPKAIPFPIGRGLVTRNGPGDSPRGLPQRKRGDTMGGHLGLEPDAAKVACPVPPNREVKHLPDSCLKGSAIVRAKKLREISTPERELKRERPTE